ncbi:nucleotidyltransferase domain-containing protein [Candidatus Woesearchaeota archaeon]|nr:nucleotidyltransferase domain-containing protein [Candidatus Woesearchaeota archaeon]
MNAEEKIFKAFYDSKKDELYFNEIKSLTGLSNSSIQNTTLALLKKNILGSQKTKANVFFTMADKERFAIEFTKIDLNRLDGLNRNIRLPLTELVGKTPNEVASVVLFGSSARKKENEKSDIDLLVVLHKFDNLKIQQAYEKEIIQKMEELKRDVQSRSVHNLSLAFTNTRLLKEGEDHLVSQAKETGFPIFNQQLYYEVIKK